MKNDKPGSVFNVLRHSEGSEEEAFWVVEQRLKELADLIEENEDQIDLWECKISDLEDEVAGLENEIAGLEKEKLAIWADPEYKRLKRLALRFPCEGQLSLLS